MKTNRALQANWPLILLFGSYTCYALWALCFGERIPVRGGLGWDGEIYYFISQDFFQYWKGRGLDGYYIQRIVPSLIVKGMHYVMGIEHAYWRTGTYFGLLNLVSMLGGTGFLLFALKSVSQKWKWMAALMALISFGTLKHPYYYPILTDSVAFLLGACFRETGVCCASSNSRCVYLSMVSPNGIATNRFWQAVNCASSHTCFRQSAGICRFTCADSIGFFGTCV